jgi:septal ring factor EnvC (AmiA/AmiB activator)
VLLLVIIAAIAAFLLSVASIVMYTKAKKEIANLKNKIVDTEKKLKSSEEKNDKIKTQLEQAEDAYIELVKAATEQSRQLENQNLKLLDEKHELLVKRLS